MVQIKDFTIETFERRGNPAGFYASVLVTLNSGISCRWNLSLLDGESTWVRDDSFGPRGVPLYVHGYGCRVTALHILEVDSQTHDLVVALDRRMATGVWSR